MEAKNELYTFETFWQFRMSGNFVSNSIQGPIVSLVKTDTAVHIVRHHLA